MSFFDKLFGDGLESALDLEFVAYKKTIDEMIAQEDDTLRSLGIEPPSQISEFSYQTDRLEKNPPYDREKYLKVTLVPPEFELPNHFLLVMHDGFIGETDGMVITFFKDLDNAESDFSWWGLGEVVRQKELFGGVWTNRDPFAFYRALQEKPYKQGINYHSYGDFVTQMQGAKSYKSEYTIHYHTTRISSPLEIVPGLTAQEAADVHLRAQLYNYVTDWQFPNLHDPFDYYALEHKGVLEIPKDIQLELPVPCTLLSNCPYSSRVIIPAGEIKPAVMVEFLYSLHNIHRFISFELIREGETIKFRLALPTEFESQIISKLNLYFPDFELLSAERLDPQKPFTVNWLNKNSVYDSIQRLRDFQLDPYAHFASLFEDSAPGEILCYQIMFAPLLDQAASDLKWQMANQPYRVSDYADKFGKRLPLWFVSINVSSTNEQTAHTLSRAVARVFDSPHRNFSEPYSSSVTHTELPLLYPTFLSLCGTDELAALAHFPVTDLTMKRLERTSMKNVQPPQLYIAEAARIGETKARGQIFPVTLPEEVRDRHVYVVGKSGTGKSTLIEAIARRDIEAGHGVAVIDPHGDLIQHLMETMPEHRVADCVLFSPKHFPVSLEILSAENEHEIDLLSDDLITMFRRTSESWGDKMQAILQMTFQTLLRVPGSSFTDITPFLTDENYRNRLLAQVDHPQLASFWQQRYDMRQAEPILIRMDRLTTSGTLRSVLTQNSRSLNFYDVITESKIFLADLSKGFLGESTSHLIGSIIVSQIQLAAMRQAHLPVEQRIPFSLFVDEVQNFTTSAFSTILSEARKQKLRLTIAHQFVSQLPTDLQKAVFGNVGTLVFFALSPDDLGAARHELGTFEPQDVANLPKYHALCRPATAARETFSFATDPPPPLPAKNYTAAIIEQTRQKYAAQTISKTEPPLTNADVEAAVVAVPPPIAQAATGSPRELDTRRPAPARPRQFAMNTEKILHFVRHAEYLSQPQIIAITGLQASNASTALKRLVDTNQLKSLDERRPKIYFVGRSCNATVHNLLVRDLVVKIFASNYAIRALRFNDQLADLNPDLTIEFLSEDGTPLPAYFELDRGTEGVGELVKKAERYDRLSGNPRVCFVFERETDMQLARKTIEYPFITYGVLEQFTSLRDSAFYASARASADNLQLPFFR